MRHLLILLTLLSTAALAESPWLCIAEQVVSLADKGSKIFEGKAFSVDTKWLVNDEGVSVFGKDVLYVSNCVWSEGRPAYCDDGQFHWARFRMSPDRVFTMRVLLTKEIAGDETLMVTDLVIKGKCSKL